MTVALLVITDGRADCLERTLASFDRNVERGELITDRIIVDDSQDPDYGEWIDRNFAFSQHVRGTRKLGFGGAIDLGWRTIASRCNHETHVFHLEDDFEFNRPFNLADMVDVLEKNRYLAQMALRRQPWNDAECRAGGVVEMWPAMYTDTFDDQGRHWLEHRLYFTTNPSVYPISRAFHRWPPGVGSEGRYSAQVFRQSEARAGLWGRRSDPPWVHHIGIERVGIDY
jgi:hypothetical protein